MRIGILTFHCAHNYGAVLQCYALQEVLKGMGHTVEVIDYRPVYLTRPYDIINPNRILSRNPIIFAKKVITELLYLPNRIKRHKKFNNFINKRYQLSTIKGISKNYDIFIMGSDQIWNPKITKGFDGYYFGYLPFPKEKRKYIAYAASMESDNLSETAKDYLRKAVCNFDAIGVRETRLADLLRPLTNQNIQVVLDPTLLVNTSIWENFINISPSEKKYVLIYQARGSISCNKKIAKHIAKQIGAITVTLSSFPTWRKNIYQSESPEAFVNWFRYASCIITTSFHGTAFSIIFNKPFYSIQTEGYGNTREISILELLGLKDRMINKNQLPTFQEIDYKQANNRLQEYRQKSFKYLLGSISNKES